MASVLARVLRILSATLTPRPRRQGRRFETAGSEQRRDEGGDQRSAPGVDPDLARYYANLEVPYGSDLDTARESWKRLVRKYHPDLHGTDPERQHVATELVKGLNQALEQLEQRLGKTK